MSGNVTRTILNMLALKAIDQQKRRQKISLIQKLNQHLNMLDESKKAQQQAQRILNNSLKVDLKQLTNKPSLGSRVVQSDLFHPQEMFLKPRQTDDMAMQEQLD